MSSSQRNIAEQKAIYSILIGIAELGKAKEEVAEKTAEKAAITIGKNSPSLTGYQELVIYKAKKYLDNNKIKLLAQSLKNQNLEDLGVSLEKSLDNSFSTILSAFKDAVINTFNWGVEDVHNTSLSIELQSGFIEKHSQQAMESAIINHPLTTGKDLAGAKGTLAARTEKFKEAKVIFDTKQQDIALLTSSPLVVTLENTNAHLTAGQKELDAAQIGINNIVRSVFEKSAALHEAESAMKDAKKFKDNAYENYESAQKGDESISYLENLREVANEAQNAVYERTVQYATASKEFKQILAEAALALDAKKTELSNSIKLPAAEAAKNAAQTAKNTAEAALKKAYWGYAVETAATAASRFPQIERIAENLFGKAENHLSKSWSEGIHTAATTASFAGNLAFCFKMPHASQKASCVGLTFAQHFGGWLTSLLSSNPENVVNLNAATHVGLSVTQAVTSPSYLGKGVAALNALGDVVSYIPGVDASMKYTVNQVVTTINRFLGAAGDFTLLKSGYWFGPVLDAAEFASSFAPAGKAKSMHPYKAYLDNIVINEEKYPLLNNAGYKAEGIRQELIKLLDAELANPGPDTNLSEIGFSMSVVRSFYNQYLDLVAAKVYIPKDTKYLLVHGEHSPLFTQESIMFRNEIKDLIRELSSPLATKIDEGRDQFWELKDYLFNSPKNHSFDSALGSNGGDLFLDNNKFGKGRTLLKKLNEKCEGKLQIKIKGVDLKDGLLPINFLKFAVNDDGVSIDTTALQTAFDNQICELGLDSDNHYTVVNGDH